MKFDPEDGLTGPVHRDHTIRRVYPTPEPRRSGWDVFWDRYALHVVVAVVGLVVFAWLRHDAQQDYRRWEHTPRVVDTSGDPREPWDQSRDEVFPLTR